MHHNQNEFGELLRALIKAANISQFEFYTKLGITKSYFYDILSGKSNPFPAPLQKKTIEILNLDPDLSISFFNLAAKNRNELPADIISIIKNNPLILDDLRYKYK